MPRRAARLAKADLTTDMVFEFTELQGTMGGIYAREEGLPEQVWKAIYYHYLPDRRRGGRAADARAARRRGGQLGGGVAGRQARHVRVAVAGGRARDRLARSVRAAAADAGSGPHPDGPAGADRHRSRGLARPRARARGRRTRRTRPGRGPTRPPRPRWPLRSSACASRSRHRGFAGEVVRAATPAGDVSPLRARRVAEALQGMRASEDFQALAVLFKRVKNIAKERARRRGRSIATRSSSRPSRRCSRRSTLRRPRIEAAAAQKRLPRRLHRDRRPARGRRSVLHRGVRHGGRRAGEARAAEAHGGSARPHPASRGHFGNHFSNGVGIEWRRSSHERPRRRRPLQAVHTKRPRTAAAEAGQVRLLLRPQDGWQRIDEAAARRQGREPRRDVPHRAAGAARVHDHHRGLHLLLRQQADVSADAAQGDGERDRLARAADRQEVRRSEEPAARLGALGRPRLDAGHDGHDPQPRPERPDRRGAGDQDRESALCVGLLPPLRADVLRRRARRAEAARRGSRSVRDGDSRRSSTSAITRTSKTPS